MAVATESPTSAVTLHWPLTDDQFAKLCSLNPDLRFESTSTGDLIIRPPTGSETSERNADLTADFVIWNRASGAGAVYDFERRNAFTAEQRQGFLPLCPDFVLELRSPSDRLAALQDKMQEYLDNGARLGWLIDPLERVVYVYRPEEAVERLEAPEEVSGESVLSGFVLRLRTVWSS
jgi:Uma2 family endonuclease